MRTVTLSHDMTRIASIAGDTVAVWNVSSGACLQMLKSHSKYIDSVAFSYDSARLALVSRDSTINIWEVSSGTCLQTLKSCITPIMPPIFSPDLTRLASASWDNIINIWDTSSGACLQTLEGHSGVVKSVAFSPDSTRLASASYDNTVKMWDASSGRCLQTLYTGKAHYDLSFDSTSSFLYTSTCTIALQNAEDSSTSDIAEFERPLYTATSLSSDSIWVKHASENMLWMPSEYRPSCSSVSGAMVGIGVGSGRVWICSIDL
jgi:WD40 repeat protein